MPGGQQEPPDQRAAKETPLSTHMALMNRQVRRAAPAERPERGQLGRDGMVEPFAWLGRPEAPGGLGSFVWIIWSLNRTADWRNGRGIDTCAQAAQASR